LPNLDLSGWTIAFDLDGTLVESAPDLIAALNVIMTQEGLPTVPVEAARHMVGHGAIAMTRKGFEAGGRPFPEDRAKEILESFIDAYLPIIARETRPFDGCLETLQALKDAGATLVVCTNKRTGLSNALLKGLDMDGYFAAVVGADDAPAPKPDARHLLFSIEEADGDPDMALMIGDSRADLGAARNAGIPVALFSFGYSDVPQSELGADVVLDHYDQLIGWVAEQTK